MVSKEELRSALAASLPAVEHTVVEDLVYLIATALNANGEPRFGSTVRIDPPPRLAAVLNTLEGAAIACSQITLTFLVDGQIGLGRPQTARQGQIGSVDARGSQGAVFNPQGPVTQIYGSQQNVHTGGGTYIEKLQVAQLILTLTAAGGMVNQVAASLPTLIAKPRPVWRPPDHVPSLVGRANETSTIFATLDNHRFVEVYGPVDIGKSALLEAAATNQTGQSLPDGTIFLRPRQTTAADLLQEIHDEFFTCSIPNLKLTDAQVTRDLQTIRARVVLDNDRLPKEELEVLLAALTGSQLILSTRERGGRHPGRIRTMALHGLSLPAARELYRITLERSLTTAEGAAVDALLATLEGRPGAIIREAVIARNEQQVLAAPTMPVPPPTTGSTPTLDLQAEQLLKQLTAEERSLVAVLATIYDARLGEEPLLRIAGLSQSSPALPTLIRQQIVRTSSPRYNLVETFTPFVLAAADAARWRERVIADLVTWMRSSSTTLEQILEEAEAVLQLLRQAVAAERWEEVLLLARAIEPALIDGRQWGTWQQVLDWQLQAARAMRDLAAEGWALHQLGTRALCLGNAVVAQTFLSQALNIRVRLGDRAGADVTRHNLNLVQPPPPPPSSTPPRAPSNPPSRSQAPSHDRVTSEREAPRQRGCLWLWILGILLVSGGVWGFWVQQSGSVDETPTEQAPLVFPATDVPPTADVSTATPMDTPTMPEVDQVPPATTTEPANLLEAISPTPFVPAKDITPAEDGSTATPTPKENEPVGQQSEPQPSISKFYATPDTIQPGDLVKLCYVTENAYDVVIDEMGSVLKHQPDKESCIDANPKDEKTIVYTLTVYNQEGKPVATATAEVIVQSSK